MKLATTGLEKALHQAVRDLEISPDVAVAWDSLPRADISDHALAKARVVTRDGRARPARAFDMLRTRLLRLMKERGWRSLAITSPTPGCGKTTTCLNLAFSFARRREGRTLLLELDLLKPEMARLLKLTPPRSVASLLGGGHPVEDCLLRVGDRLAFGLATERAGNSAELLQSAVCAEALWRTSATLAPDVILYDLPPVFAADDALGFAPKADCALVLAAEGQSALGEIDRCVAQLSRVTNVLGVVLSKSAFPSADGYGYYGYGG